MTTLQVEQALTGLILHLVYLVEINTSNKL
jgi:hypothetical protein